MEKLRILKKLATDYQLEWEFLRSQTADKNKEFYKPFDGFMAGQPYWLCNDCERPIKDEHGNLISDPKLIKKWDTIREVPSAISKDLEVFKNRLYLINSENLHSINNLDRLFERIPIDVWAVGKIIHDIVKSYSNLLNWNNIVHKPEYLKHFEEIYSKSKSEAKNLDNKLSDQTSSNNYFKNIQEAKLYADSLKQELLVINANLEKAGQELLSSPILSEQHQEIIKTPYCNNCYENYVMCCEEKECDYCSDDESDFSEAEIRYQDQENITNLLKEPKKKTILLCPEHGFTCSVCDRGFKKNDTNGPIEKNHDPAIYCDECFYEQYSFCDGCGEIFDSEDMMYEGDGNYCHNCYDPETEDGIDEELTFEEKSSAKNFAALNPQMLLPVDEKTIKTQIIPAFLLTKKRNFDLTSLAGENSLETFIMSKVQTKEAKAAIKALLFYIKPYDYNLDLAVKALEDQLLKLQNFKENYPSLSGFRFLPVEVRVEDGRGHGGMVFALYPSKDFFNYAEQIVPGIESVYDNLLASKGHHRGAIGYARVTSSNGNIIIDNFQNDLDAQSIREIDIEKLSQEEQVALKWFLAAIKKFWAPYLLDIIKQFAKKNNLPVYLTSYEMQQKKWKSIPERNKDYYERVPEMMGFTSEEVEAKPEDLKRQDYYMRRIAQPLINSVNYFYNKMFNR